MNTFHWSLVAAPCVALAAFAPAFSVPSSPSSCQQGPGQPILPELSDVAVWRERLSVSDLDAREQAFDELASRAAQDEKDRASIEAWARDDSDREFAWSCRLALREARSRNSPFDPAAGMHDPFEALRRRMFSSRGGSQDPFQGFLFVDPFSSGGQGTFGHVSPFGLQPGASSQSSFDSFILELGPDGVKARVKKNVDGVVSEEEFSAKTIEELLQAHPELSAHLGQQEPFGRGTWQRLALPGYQFDKLLRGGLRTDLLGVRVPATPDAGGLRIDSVLPGTLAEQLGLQAGDVLVSINGREVKARDDISAALRERQPDQGLEVQVRDGQGELRTRSWKPSSEPRGKAYPLLPGASGSLRKL